MCSLCASQQGISWRPCLLNTSNEREYWKGKLFVSVLTNLLDTLKKIMYILLLRFITSGKTQIIFHLPSTFQNFHQKIPLSYRVFFLLHLEVIERALYLISCTFTRPCLLNILWLILIWQGFEKDIDYAILNGVAMSLYYSAPIRSPWWHLGLLLSVRFLSFWTAYKIWVGFICKNFKHDSAVFKSKRIRMKKYFVFL